MILIIHVFKRAKKKIRSISYGHALSHILFSNEEKMGMVRLSEGFFPAFFNSYFIAFGVMFGGSLIGGLASFITGEPLLTEISKIARDLRIWAIIAAIGGTFDTVYSFEKGFLESETMVLFKQLLLILSAMGGAKTAALIISWITQENVL